jgi:hypothetical protein
MIAVLIPSLLKDDITLTHLGFQRLYLHTYDHSPSQETEFFWVCFFSNTQSAIRSEFTVRWQSGVAGRVAVFDEETPDIEVYLPPAIALAAQESLPSYRRNGRLSWSQMKIHS